MGEVRHLSCAGYSARFRAQGSIAGSQSQRHTQLATFARSKPPARNKDLALSRRPGNLLSFALAGQNAANSIHRSNPNHADVAQLVEQFIRNE